MRGTASHRLASTPLRERRPCTGRSGPGNIWRRAWKVWNPLTELSFIPYAMHVIAIGNLPECFRLAKMGPNTDINYFPRSVHFYEPTKVPNAGVSRDLSQRAPKVTDPAYLSSCSSSSS